MTTCITHIACITQVTFKFIGETLLVDNRGLKLMSLKLLLELRAYKHWLDSDVQLGTSIVQFLFNIIDLFGLYILFSQQIM